MSEEASLKLLTLTGVIHRCQQENDRFYRRLSHDPRYCYELFRRAFLHGNQRAWEHTYTTFSPLVAGWVKRHSAFPATGEEIQYFVNRAFAKMWSALSPERFDQFPDLGSLLSYLQACVHSAVVDAGRSRNPAVITDPANEALTTKREEKGSSIEDRALNRAQHEEFWHLIEERLKDKKERLVVQGSFVQNLKPRELYAEFEYMFSGVEEIYRIKQNVIARLRRDDELAGLLEINV